jgi:multidrug resistance efflux pump
VEANGPSRSPTRLPKTARWSKRSKILLSLGIVGLLLGGAGIIVYILVAKPFRDVRTDLITHKVGYGRLELTIVERGALESANNHDIVCRVKARSQGSQTSTTIKWIIDDGSQVLRDRPKSEVQSIISWDPKTSTYLEKPGSPTGTVRVVEVSDRETGGANAGLGAGVGGLASLGNGFGGQGGFSTSGGGFGGGGAGFGGAGFAGAAGSGHTIYSDLVVDLDESGLIEQMKAQKITLDQAEAGKIKAEEDYKIQVSQNESDIKTAETILQLSIIDLDKYLKGDFPQALKDVEGRIKVAESDVEQQRDRAAWAQRMLKKGYYTVSQADSEQSKLQSYELALAKVGEEKRVLTDKDYGLRKRTETDLGNRFEEAKRLLARIQSQARAREVQARTDRDSKKSVYEQERTKYKDIEEEIKKCKLCAPIDGLVVYYVPEQTRWGVGRQALVAQGEAVAENQKLMQIPDLKHMFVNTKVHEALVSRIHKGQPAMVRVDAMADHRLKAHVESVANTPSQQDFFASDVKVYATKIYIDEEVDGLKPGMTAEVTITVADALEHVLTLPIQAIVGSAEMGGTRECFVMTLHGPEKREITVGMSTDKEAEIRDGLMQGDEVVINPKVLVGDKAKTREVGELSKNGGASQDNSAKNKENSGKGSKGAAGKGREGKTPAGAQRGGPAGSIGQVPTDQAAAPKGGPPMNPEEQEKRRKEMIERYRQASPEKRKEMMDQIPEPYRGPAKNALKAAGIDVKD